MAEYYDNTRYPGPATGYTSHQRQPCYDGRQVVYPDERFTNFQQQQFPLTNQPQMYDQMGMQGYRGSSHVNLPIGLEHLSLVDTLQIKQKLELREILCGCESNNRYKIKDVRGQVMFRAKEDTDCCTRNCCGSSRPFEMEIRDANEEEVIHLTRPFACDGCLPMCLQSIEVFAPPGQLIGTVQQECSFCYPSFLIKDSTGSIVMKIDGPLCTSSFCCDDVEFQILSEDGSQNVGRISKKWMGCIRESYTDADNFEINFPLALDTRMKAVLIGACFLIDFMYYENNQQRG